jgi:hypothetical protein
MNSVASNAPQSQTIVELPIEELTKNYLVDVRNTNQQSEVAAACAHLHPIVGSAEPFAFWAEPNVESLLPDRLVHVAPLPVFAGLERTDDRMLRRMEVLGRVFVLGRVAAPDVAAFVTEAQMDPGVSHLQALFAAVGRVRRMVV